MKKHFPQDRAKIERPDTPEALTKSSEPVPHHGNLSVTPSVTNSVRKNSFVGNHRGAKQCANDGFDDKAKVGVKRDTNLTELTTALISERHNNEKWKAGSQEIFKGESEESSEGQIIPNATGNTEVGESERDSVQYLQELRPKNEQPLNIRRASLRRVWDRCAGLFRKAKE